MSTKRVFLLTALSSVVLLVALAYFGYELSETRKENRELLQQLLQVRQQGGGNREGQEAYLKGAVKNTIVKHAQSIQGCYLSLIESTPELPDSGKVMADWQIDPRGEVFEAGVVRDEFSNKEFQSCIRKNIGNIVFPAPPSGRSVYVEHTFLFRKEENN